jgi:hypothetical protein
MIFQLFTTEMGKSCMLLGRHTGLPILETVDKSRHIGDELRCHRGYKPLLHVRRSGDLHGYGNSAQSEPATSAPLKETVKTVKALWL